MSAKRAQLKNLYLENEAFDHSFRKKRRAQLRLQQHHTPAPPPEVSLAIVEGYELCPDVSGSDSQQSELPLPLQPRERVTCFRKVLDQQLNQPTLPPISLVPQPPPEPPKSKSARMHPAARKLSVGLPVTSKKLLSAVALGELIHRLQHDQDKYEVFKADLNQRVKSSIRDARVSQQVDIKRNIESTRLHFPTQKRQMQTARMHLQRIHAMDVMDRGMSVKTARATSIQNKAAANEAKRIRGVERIGRNITLHKQQKAAFIVALHARTSLLVAKLCENRTIKFNKHRKLVSSIRIQRAVKRWLLWNKSKIYNDAQCIIARGYKRWRIRKILRNRRQAADCLLSWLRSLSQKSMPYLVAVQNLISTVRNVQQYWRNYSLMWNSRLELHEHQWIREESGVIQDLQQQFNKESISIPPMIPTHIRQKVLKDFMARAKDQHASRLRKFHSTLNSFMRRHRRTIDQRMSMALKEGAISIKLSSEDFMEFFMPEVYAKKPIRPMYQFALSQATMEDLVLDAARLAMDEASP